MIRQRLITALVLAALLLGAIFYLPPLWLGAALGVLLVGGFWEWAGFAGFSTPAQRAPYVVSGALLLTLCHVAVFRFAISPVVILGPAAIWWAAALVWVIRYPTPVSAMLVHAASVLVLVPAWLGLVLLAQRVPDGPLWLFCAFLMVWAADTGAYFSGKAFGKNKLAPAVSPGKTWEGVAGGAVLCGAVAAGMAPLLGMPPGPFGLCAIAIALASVVGDLIVSLFKRNAGLKDSGKLFPGHGGILDRIDSVCAAAPLLALGMWLVDRA
ncbi:MAG: phosphatidate cytidylyltransferase [Pseudomonadota bacterium]